MSKEFIEFLQQRGISQALTVALCPLCNGQEVAVRYVKEQYKPTSASFGCNRLQDAMAVLRMAPGGSAVSFAKQLLGRQSLTLLAKIVPEDTPEPTGTPRFKCGDAFHFRTKRP